MRRLICAIICAFPATVFAVGTSHWVHTTEADFKAGKFENVVATNLGDLKLSRAVKMLLEQDPKVSSVYALVEAADGTIYAGTGPQGVLLAIKDDKVSTALTLKDNESIFSLAIDKEGRLLLGTGGEKGRILRVDKAGDAPKEIFAPEAVQYIWAMQVTPDGSLYAATGPTGQLFEILPSGSHTAILDSDEHNLLSLLSDGKDMLYVGTDPHGLVYRVNRKTREAFVLYDAEAEVSALALDAAGNLYAGTAAASAVTEGDAEDAGTTEKTGRPENASGGVPIPSSPPSEPKPPELPPPNPGEPAPIPKNPKKEAEPPKLVILADDGESGDKGDHDQGKPTPGRPKPPGSPTPPASHAAKPRTTKSMPPIAAGKSIEPAEKGNAIYRIDPDGFVTEIFRQPVLVMSLLERDGKLLVGTGSDGTVYQVDPAAEETVALAKVDPKQIMTLMAAKDGRIYMGLANVGSLATMSRGFATDGTFTSAVLDATQVSRFGKMRLQGSLPEGSQLKVSTRSGNVEAPEDKGWSPWTTPAAAIQLMPVESPSARFFQYRLTLTSKDGGTTPVVDEVDVAYQVPNLAPVVKSVHITPAPAKGGADAAAGAGDSATSKNSHGLMTVTWEATDANEDTLLYSLYYRLGPAGKWILLKDKLKDTTYDWDTRNVGDGQYVLKIVASDESANPRGTGKTGNRVSDPVFIDNTPPAIGDLVWQKQANGVKVSLKVVDRASTVAAVAYSVDSNTDWQAVLPSDNIFDAPEETVSFPVDSSPGQHQLTVRATDAHGNQAFESLLVTVEAK